MDNWQPDRITIITLGIAFLIGIILLVIGSRAKKRMLSIVGTGFCIGVATMIFVESTYVRDVLTAFAAIAAVVIAAFSIDQSRRMRKDSIDRESRDRKERLLKEIIDWGESIRRCSFVSNLEELSVVLKLTGDDKRRVWALKNENEYRIVAVKYAYLKNVASELGASMQSAIKTVSDDLARHIVLLGQEFDGKTKESDVPNSINTLQKSVNKMIEVAAGLLPE